MEQESNQKLFDEALRNSNADTILSLLKDDAIDMNYRDIAHDLTTYLMRICHSNLGETQLTEVLQVADTKPLDLNLLDALGRSLAVHACIARRPSVLEFSIARNCDIKQADRNGKNLVHHAACTGSDEIVDIILKHPDIDNASRTLDFQGNSPVDLARQRKFTSVARKLGSLLKAKKQSQTEASHSNEALGWPEVRNPPQHSFQPLPQSEAAWLQGKTLPLKQQPLGSLASALPNETNGRNDGLPTDLANSTAQSKALSPLKHPCTPPSTNSLLTPRRDNPQTLKPLNAEEIDQISENLSPRQRSRNMPPKIQTNVFDQSISEHVPPNKQISVYSNLGKPMYPRQNNSENMETLTTPADVIFGAKDPDYQAKNRASTSPRSDILGTICPGSRNQTGRQRLTAYSLPGQLGNRQEQMESEPKTNSLFKRSPVPSHDFPTHHYRRPIRGATNLNNSESFETTGINEISPEKQNRSFQTDSPRLKERNGLLQKRNERPDLSMKQANSNYIFGSTEDESCIFEEEISLAIRQSDTPTHKPSKKNQPYQRNGENLSPQNENDTSDRLRHRRSSISLPDLRDMGEFLVSSKEQSLLQMLAHDKHLRKTGNNFDSQEKSNQSGINNVRKNKRLPRNEDERENDHKIDDRVEDNGDFKDLHCNGSATGFLSERAPKSKPGQRRTLPSLNSCFEKK